jgi:hypothetical protein
MDAFVERYVAVWNEPDAQVRRASVEALWTPDGAMVNRLRRYAGHVAVAEGVTRSYDAFVGRGFRFEAEGWRAHHEALLFSWLMRDPQGAVDSRGTNFIQLAGDGRIVLDHQFAEPPEGD